MGTIGASLMSAASVLALAALSLAGDLPVVAPQPARPPEPLPAVVRQLERRIERLERAFAVDAFGRGMRAVRGSWTIEGDRLVSPSEGDGILQLPVEPTDEYVLTVRVERVSGTNTFAIGAVAGDRQVLVALDAHESTVSGLEHLDGSYVHENEAARRGPVFVAGQESEVVCVVRKDRITCVVDDMAIVDWQGDFGRLSVPEAYAVPNVRALSIVTLNTSYAVRDIRFAPLGLPGPPVE